MSYFNNSLMIPGSGSRIISALSVTLLLGPLACSKDKPAHSETKTAAAPSSAPSSGSGASTAPAEAASLPAPPKSLGGFSTPKNNPTTPAKVVLGRKLFFDKRLSADGSRACYSCHEDKSGSGGALPKAIGAKEKQLSRHAPSMWNVAYLPRLYWDGRADSLEAQAKGAWAGGNMGVGKDNLLAKADEIGALPEYKAEFDAVFPGDGATPETITQAIAAFERTLLCGDTAFDRFDAGDESALNESQKRGWDLFQNKAACKNCHTPPFFSDAVRAAAGAYHNVGIGIEGLAAADIDPGREKVSENPSEWAAFKTPSLRNVSKTAPYFHDGSVVTLEAAVRFMAGGGFKNKNLDSKLDDKKLSDEEVQNLVSFLGALDCTGSLKP
ncbi:MAG: c-type cytochrome [Polyangiaceae bacterium]|nr:c-type cytochrome [Polyangiaceae bacterium]